MWHHQCILLEGILAIVEVACCQQCILLGGIYIVHSKQVVVTTIPKQQSFNLWIWRWLVCGRWMAPLKSSNSWEGRGWPSHEQAEQDCDISSLKLFVLPPFYSLMINLFFLYQLDLRRDEFVQFTVERWAQTLFTTSVQTPSYFWQVKTPTIMIPFYTLCKYLHKLVIRW